MKTRIFKKAKDLLVGDIVHGRGIVYKIEANKLYFYSLYMSNIDNNVEMLSNEDFDIETDKGIILSYFNELDKLLTKNIEILVNQRNKLDKIHTKVLKRG